MSAVVVYNGTQFRGYFALSRPRSEGLDPPSPPFGGTICVYAFYIVGILNSFGPSFIGPTSYKQVTGPYPPEKIVGVFSFGFIVQWSHVQCSRRCVTFVDDG